MKANFDMVLKSILVFEGGKDDDPVDPGGRTNQGVIQRVYTAYRIRNGRPNQDVFLMNNTERDEIYRTQYFDKVQFNELPPGVDMCIVDGAVNSGVSQSIKWVQRALGLTANGVLGEVTMQRIQDHPDHDKLIADICARRLAMLKQLRTFYRFGAGWTSRVNQLKRKCQLIAMGSVGPEVDFVPNGNKKALVMDAKPLPSTAPADATAAGGTVSGALSTVQGVFQPMQGTPFADKVLLFLAVGGGLLAVGGVLYGIWARRRRDAMIDVLDLVATQVGPADNDNVPEEVVAKYADPTARGGETGNIAEGHVTTSGRVAGDTEVRFGSESKKEAAA